MGLQYAAAAYTAYTLPILSFVGQLGAPSPAALEMEAKALRNMTPGPYRWCAPEDLFHLSELYGQARAFPSLLHMCMAAQKRVYEFENRHHGGLQIDTKFCELRTWKQDSEHTNRIFQWFQWFDKGPVATLYRNSRDLDSMKLDTITLLQLARQGGRRRTEGSQGTGSDQKKIPALHASRHRSPPSPRPHREDEDKDGKVAVARPPWHNCT